MTQTAVGESSAVHERIINSVAALENTDPIELPALFDAVDPDALEAIFADPRKGGLRTGRVEFPYAGYTVSIEFDEEPVLTIE